MSIYFVSGGLVGSLYME